MKGIGGAGLTLGDHGLLQTPSIAQLLPATASAKGFGDAHAQDIQQCRAEVNQAKEIRGLRSGLARRAEQERNSNQFFRNFIWRVKASTMIQKLLAMIGSERENTILPAVKLLQGLDEPGNLRVH